jgi:hypothetical protein
MLAVPASKLPIGDEWTYEVKLDGYRTLALKDGQRVILLAAQSERRHHAIFFCRQVDGAVAGRGRSF